jgi:hypothetical protein
MYAFTFTPD